VDLMVGVPGQTRDEVLRDLISVVALCTAYFRISLEVHEGTHFGVLPRVGLGRCDLLLMVEKFLTEHGYEHYEISTMPDRGTNVFTTKSTGTTRSTTL